MALPVPNLDDRTFQDLVNEARRRIPLYCPEWTDHNLSDPGITLIELFAWMTELLIYRLNKVPDKNYIKFLELIGVRLAPANPATTDITFRLSAPPATAITIPRGTEVATVRTETQEAIVFTTSEDLTISPPVLEAFLLSQDGSRFDDRLPLLREWEGLQAGLAAGGEAPSFPLFQPVPEPGNAFYLGFSSDLRGTVLVLNIACDERAAHGINPSNPPLLWEYWDGAQQGWALFQRRPEAEAWLESDGTRGFNQNGSIVLHVPRTAAETTVGLRQGYWIRCRVTPWTQEQGSYEQSPRLRAITCRAVGGTVPASNSVRVVGEVLGTSNGKPGQVMKVAQVPMLPLGPGEVVEVQKEDNTGWEAWQEVKDFSASGPLDKHYICDPVTGEVQFGPAIRSPNGQEVQHGAIPPRGSQVRLTSYRYGGGPRGNVGRGTLTVLKTSIPYVASVTNRRPASGGVDPESVENAKLRGPQALRTRNRAVTAEDFEYLAREASPSVGRARCVQPGEVGQEGTPQPGVVQVLLVPAMATPKQQLTPQELALSRELREQVKQYLDDRRVLTSVLVVTEPEYLWVSVEARVKVRRGADPQSMARAVEQKLYQFIHPLYGGPEGTGWPFGRDLFTSELYAQIQTVPGVEYVEELLVFPVDPESGKRGEVTQRLKVPPTGLLCSHSHKVTCS